jgi:hypothetical protein
MVEELLALVAGIDRWMKDEKLQRKRFLNRGEADLCMLGWHVCVLNKEELGAHKVNSLDE